MNTMQRVLGMAALAAGLAAALLAATSPRGATRAGEIGSCGAYAGLPAGNGEAAGMVFISGGTFRMGSDSQQPEERHTHQAGVDGFWIDRHEVTNAQFKQFIDATGYVTLAEREIDPKSHPNQPKELLTGGSAVFVQPTQQGRKAAPWWQYVAGASWRRPAGPDSSIADRLNHPVAHIAYEDALAYAKWRGRSLPTEAQWEFAARGGRDGEDDWSSAFDAKGKPIANTWQGIFPVLNTTDDGFAGTAPVGCFAPNGYGLYDMIGNVWEWTSDWYEAGHAPDPVFNPAGPSVSRAASRQAHERVIKGGSHLCAANYCSRYRPAARQPQEVDLSAGHLGFRTVLNKPSAGKSS